VALRIPRFKPQHGPLIRPGEGVLLVGELASRALHRDLHAQVAGQIDGVRDVDAIVSALAGTVPAARVHDAVMLLEKAGHIVEASGPAMPVRIRRVTPPCRTASDSPRGAGRAVPDRPLGGERPSPIPSGTAARGAAGSPAFLAMLAASPSSTNPTRKERPA
jgi:hypothetical protein